MKWLHLTAGNLYGGIETYLSTQARYQSQCPDYEIEYGLCFAGRHYEELVSIGVTTHLLGEVRVSRPWTVLGARRRLEKLINGSGFDGIACHGPWVHALFAPVAKACNLRVVFFAHSNYRGQHWTERTAKRSRPDAVIFSSRFCMKDGIRFWKDISEDLIYCPVAKAPNKNPLWRSDCRRDLKTEMSSVVVIQAARMEAWKGHEATLTAFARLSDLPAVLWIAGGAQREKELLYLKRLESLASSLGISSKVRFLGDRRDVRDLMLAADLYCQPNLEAEPFGISFVEAMYAGLPVVAYDAGGPGEIVSPDCGILVLQHDEAALASALRQLVQDSYLRGVLSTAAPKRADALCNPVQQIHKQAKFLSGLLSR